MGSSDLSSETRGDVSVTLGASAGGATIKGSVFISTGRVSSGALSVFEGKAIFFIS